MSLKGATNVPIPNMAATGRGVPLLLLLLLMTVALPGSVCGPLCSARSVTEKGAPAGTVKTIKDLEYGVLIDCIDIYKQPALQNPLLNDHVIQMEPSSPLPVRQEEEERGESKEVLPARQSWLKYGECPKGTIPIIRTEKRLGEGAPALHGADSTPVIENANVFKTREKYTGVHARCSLWEPAVEAGEQSNARIWLMASDDQSDDVDIISLGWMVDPNWVYPNQTVPVIFWASSKHRHLGGCYNTQCGGFVQVDETFSLGHPFPYVSIYDGRQYATDFTITKDPRTGYWWAYLMNKKLEYWPSTLFTALRDSADMVTWGGHVKSQSAGFGGLHTKTQMGSGHFPTEGYGRSCYFRDLWYTTLDSPTSKKQIVNEKDLHRHTTRPNCYDVMVAEDEDWGVYFYFGGPGFSKKCRR